MNNHRPKVSIIIVNYNGMPYIETCITSVMVQSKIDFEVILVDNNSSDGSVNFVKDRFPNTVVVENRQNLGYSRGINSGIARARGIYLAPLNVDIEVTRDWLSPMVEFMDDHPDVGAVTPKSLLYSDRKTVGAMGLNINITGLGFVRGLNEQDNLSSSEPFQVASVSGCSFVVRRDLVEQMGGLNEDNFLYYDDVDLSWMVNLMGYKIYCVPRSTVYHEYKLKMTPQKIFWLERGRWGALLSYLRPVTILLLTPTLALTELLVFGYCTVRGPKYLWAKSKAVVDVLSNLQKIKRRRRQVQKLRSLSDFDLLRRFKINYEWGQLFRIVK